VPTLAELGASRWIEMPLGIALCFKFHDFGAKLWAYCSPVAATASTRHT